ncbi:MAG TPA: serine hydrolase domain-containing protein [Candidatus Dormibacteraeota bacterium]|nr:serine hydrolase domain-containing protein [Candidatus Dormibacteraeota bacterium]
MDTGTAVDRVLDDAVAAGEVPGVVALAGDDAGVVYEGAFGRRAVDGDAPMTADTVFWIASMTKAVTSVAALQLVEQARLDLDRPLAEVLPELAGIQVLEGFADDGEPRLRAPRRAVTLRRLLSHTAGFTYDIWNADMGRYMAHAGVPGIIECREVTLRTPLMFDPGDRWEYGINIDWVGRAVERVSDRSLEDYLREHVFEPLGMRDSGFVLRPDQRARLARMHVRNPDGSLNGIDFEIPQQPEFFMGGGGLYSVGGDYLRFLRMLLGGGALDGVRVLRPETVEEASRNQIGDLSVGLMRTAIPSSSNDAEFFPGMAKKWGLVAMISTEVAPTGRGAASLAWAGLANTYYWIDTASRLTGVLLTQVLPFADERVLRLFADFETAMYVQHRS